MYTTAWFKVAKAVPQTLIHICKHKHYGTLSQHVNHITVTECNVKTLTSTIKTVTQVKQKLYKSGIMTTRNEGSFAIQSQNFGVK